MFSDYEIVVGLETHVEISTKSKLFCGCTTAFGGEPNSHVCPVCLGLPGGLPVLNKKAVEYAIQTSLALNCHVAEMGVFARKHYFYPDLPKAFQISMPDLPLGEHGFLDIVANGEPKRIRVRRLHLEEDAGKLLHYGNITTTPYSLADYNRSGIPLMEIVTEPDIRTPEEAGAYLEKLKAIIQFLGTSDCKMEEGSLRCDANVSLRRKGTLELNVKTEIKNLNSFRAVQRGIEYEALRQYELLMEGKPVVLETRHWNEEKGITQSMRGKVEAYDYRCLADPCLVPLRVGRPWVETLRESLPELPEARRQRFITKYGLPEYDAGQLTAAPELGEFLDATVGIYGDPKAVGNWIMGDMMRCLNAAGQELADCRITPAHLAGMLKLLDQGVISSKMAKNVFEEMFASGKNPGDIVKEKGMVQISSEDELGQVIDRVIAANPQPLAEYLAGKTQVMGFFVGQVMKQTKGKANPGLVNELLQKRLADKKH